MSSDVALRQLATVFRGLTAAGDDPRAWLRVAGVVDADPSNLYARIPWSVYVEILERAREAYGREWLVERAREAFRAPEAIVFRSALLLTHSRVLPLYEAICAPDGVLRRIVPHLDLEGRRIGGTFELRSRVPDGAPWNEAYDVYSAEVLRLCPEAILEAPARVDYERVGPEVTYRITPAPPRPLAPLRRLRARLRPQTAYVAAVDEAFAALIRRHQEVEAAREEQRAAERALARRERLDALGELASGIAHDFANVLLAARGHAELLADHGDGAVREGATVIREALDRGVGMTRRLLVLARDSDTDPEPLEIDAWLAELTPLLRGAVPRAVHLTVAAGAPGARVHVPRSDLDAAIVNLVVNARDAMGEVGRIEVRTERVDGGFVRIRMLDTGPGFPAEIRDRAFEPFFTTKGAGIGSGLGLAQVWRCCDRAGGRAFLGADGPAGGAEVILDLPEIDAGRRRASG